MKCYNQIPESKNILSALIGGLKQDPVYLAHLDDKKLNKDTVTKRIGEIRIFNTKINPLFNVSDIGVILGMSHIRMLVRKYEKEEKIEGYIMYKGREKKITFLTKNGVIRACFASRSPIASLFRKFIYALIEHMYVHHTDETLKVMAKVKKENPMLVDECVRDLKKKLTEIEKKYIAMEKEKNLWERKAEDEHQLRVEIEADNAEVEMQNTFAKMTIQQLKNEKKSIYEKLTNNDDESEAEILRRRHWLKFNVYVMGVNTEDIPHPDDIAKYYLTFNNCKRKGYIFVCNLWVPTKKALVEVKKTLGAQTSLECIKVICRGL